MSYLLTLPALLVAIGASLRAAPSTTQAALTSPGLKLTLKSADVASQSRDALTSRLLAIAVPDGASPSPFLPGGAFQASWEGFINLKIRGDYTFTAQGNGGFELLINGQSVLKAAGADLSTHSSARIRLKKGPNAILARYDSPAKGSAELRLYWAEKTEPAQPLSPTLFTHDPSDPALIRQQKLRLGRELFTGLRCAKCHAVESAMPESQMDAPPLADVGSRLKPDWMAGWINDPKSVRADASMPRLFRGTAEIDPRALDVAAHLASLRGTHESPTALKPPDTARGARLFTGLGCVACHSFEQDPAGAPRISLSSVGQKWFEPALVEYLLAPHAGYKWNPMPDFKLNPEEARQLAAYIFSRSPGEAPTTIDLSHASAQRGKELLASSGCLNCHTLADERTTLDRIRPSEFKDGCLSEEASERGKAPDFGLSGEHRAALNALLASGADSFARDTPADFAQRQIRLLKCTACHDLDSQQATWTRLKQEIDAIEKTLPAMDDQLSGDQSRPSLTWVGEKLRADWMAEFIAGKVEPKPRPWLRARMPGFPARARNLAEGLPLQHGFIPRVEAEAPIDAHLAETGRKLVGKEGGFGCNTCHAVGSAAATSPFEAHGPNLMYTTGRMRKEFYHLWVGDPQRYEPGTRMPQYEDSRGKTALRDTLEGHAGKQFEAIWQYLRAGEKIEPPDR